MISLIAQMFGVIISDYVPHTLLAQIYDQGIGNVEFE